MVLQGFITEYAMDTKKIRMECLLLIKKRLRSFGIFMTGILNDIVLEVS